MQIREALPEDGLAITDELLRPSYRESEEIAPEFNSLDEETIADADCSRWLDHEQRALFIAEHDGNLVGYVSGLFTESPPIYSRNKRLHLDGLYVKPAYRRQSVATELVDRIEAWGNASGCDYVGVTVHVNNKSAKQFYDERFELTFYGYRENIA